MANEEKQTAPSSADIMKQFDAYMAAGGATASKPSFIGVPDDYATPGKRRVMGIADVAMPGAYDSPRYVDGAQYEPNSMPGPKIADLQRELAAAGLLKGKYRNGVWDDKSVKAYEELLSYANQSGVTWDEALRRYVATGGEAGEGGGKAPLVKRVSNPDDLKAILETVTTATIGRRLSDAQMQHLVAEYQAAEMAEQDEEYDLAERGGVMTAAPSAQAFLERRVREQNPTLAATYDEFEMASEAQERIGQVNDASREFGV